MKCKACNQDIPFMYQQLHIPTGAITEKYVTPDMHVTDEVAFLRLLNKWNGMHPQLQWKYWRK